MADDPLFGVHATALALRSQRMAMLASNIANASTPGYKARDIDFDTAMQLAQAGETPDAAASAAAADRVPRRSSRAYRTTLAFLQGRIDTVMSALKGE